MRFDARSSALILLSIKGSTQNESLGSPDLMKLIIYRENFYSLGNSIDIYVIYTCSTIEPNAVCYMNIFT